MSEEPGGESLKDQDLQAFAVVSEAELASGHPLPADRWVVAVDDQAAPVAALAPGSVPATGTDAALSPPFIVADAELELNAALRSPVFKTVGKDTGVVLVEGGKVVGVWSGPTLTRAVLRGPSRLTGSVLPGMPHILAIVRHCKYTEGGTSCGTVTTFPMRPAALPPCANTHGLSQHTFVW